MNYAKYLMSIGEFKKFQIPKIIENHSEYAIWNPKGVWIIDNLDSRFNFRDINDEFLNWCKKKEKIPEYGYRDINKQVRPNINGELTFTFIIKFEYKVSNFIFKIKCLKICFNLGTC